MMTFDWKNEINVISPKIVLQNVAENKINLSKKQEHDLGRNIFSGLCFTRVVFR